MGLVLATIMMCPAYQPTNCNQFTVKVERRVCGMHSNAERPVNGEWQRGTVRIICR